MTNAGRERPKRNPEIRYINPVIPAFEVPLPQGTRYRDRVPDTLDLAERARHLLHAMNETTDPEANAEIYFHLNIGWKPITMWHEAADCCEYKYYAPSLLLRQACGSDARQDVEWHRMANVAQMQAPDGLLYTPLIGRPWGRVFGFASDERTHASAMRDAEHVLWTGITGRLLEAAGVYYHLTRDPQWLAIGRRMVDGLPRIITDCGRYAYLNKTIMVPGEGAAAPGTPIPAPNRTHYTVWLSIGLTTFYRLTGYEPARELGLKLARCYQLGHGGFVGPGGVFQCSHDSWDFQPGQFIHFHMNTLTRVMLLEAGLANGERELVDLARAGFEYGKAHGETLMGFFPESLGEKRYSSTCEFCEVAEMIYMATAFSKAGVADYWDDADRWLRNMFAEGQLLETDWARAYSDAHGVSGSFPYRVTEQAAERFRGAVGGWMAPNDWQGNAKDSVMTCCLGNTAMMLYRTWRDMITEDVARNRLSVHLLMNRAGRWADIHSHLPYRGQVDVKLKAACEVALRMPEWVQAPDCTVTVNGGAARPDVEGRYLVVRGRAGDTIVLRCPLTERKDTLRINDTDYRVVVRGNEIVDIDPPGERCPIFQRPEYRQDETRWIDLERFVSQDVLHTY